MAAISPSLSNNSFGAGCCKCAIRSAGTEPVPVSAWPQSYAEVAKKLAVVSSNRAW